MTDHQFKLKDLSKTQCLQKDNKVYWEISFQQPNKTTICCGKLLANQKKDNICAKSLERTHKTIKDIIKYIEEQVNNKLSKGYQKLEVELIFEQTPVSPEIFNELGKRAKSGGNSSDIENIEPYKKRHLNEKDENKQTIENIQKSLKALQRDRASSQKSSVSKQFLTVPGSETFDSKDDKKGKVSERKLSSTGVSNTQQPYTFIKEYGSPVKALSDGGDDDMEEETIPSSSKKEDVASRKEEFEKRVALLSETNMPFGKPIFEGFNALCRYSTWVDEDLTGWYFSNKLGGIRCVWNGLEMWSKNGTKHDIPDYFIEELPNSPLEGELWTHKGNFTACMSIVKKPKSDLAWNDLGFKVLDAPTLEEPFEERLQKLKKYFEHPEKSNVYVSLENYKICGGKNDAISQLENVEAAGGEGIIFRNPKSLHGKGKTSAVLEARSRFEAKAVVEEIITAKKGKNVGDLGSIRVKNVADGTEFLINRGISDEVRKNPPQVKDVILYKFSGKLDSNKPKAPIFVKVISDN